MLNLVRMDLYRLKRSRSFYICLGCLCFVSVFSMFFLVAMMSPGFREWATQNGMEITGSDVALTEEFGAYSILEIFSKTNIQGGFFAVVAGILTAILVCRDFSSGFIKNISILCKHKWYYAAAKVIVLSLMNLICIIVTWLTTLAANLILGGIWEAVPLKNTALYMAVIWLLFTAFSALFVLIAVAVRSMAASIGAAIVLGGGLAVVIVYAILSNLGIGGFMQHTLYFILGGFDSSSTAAATTSNIVMGLVYLAVYTIAAGIFIEKRDI